MIQLRKLLNNPDKFIDIIVPGKRDSLEYVREKVLNSFAFFSNDQKTCSRLELVLEEIILNICDYAYKKNDGFIELKTWADQNNFFVQIQDSGKYFNLLEFDKPDTESLIEDRKIGGLGIHFIKNFTSTIEYKRENNKNIIKFSVRIS